MTKRDIKVLDGLEFKTKCYGYHHVLKWNEKAYGLKKWGLRWHKNIHEAGNEILVSILAEIEARKWVYTIESKINERQDYEMQLDCVNAYDEIEETFTVNAKTLLECTLKTLAKIVRIEKT